MADGTAPSNGGTGPTPPPSGNTPTPPDPHEINKIHDEAAQARATAQANDPEDPGTGGIDPRTVDSKLRHAQSAQSEAIGAGFQFTPEQVELQLNHCQEQITDLTTDLRSAERATEAVHEPAPDDASVTQANAVRNMMQNVVEVIRADIAYLTDWQNRLVAAKNLYMANEHLSEQQWLRLAQGLPQ